MRWVRLIQASWSCCAALCCLPTSVRRLKRQPRSRDATCESGPQPCASAAEMRGGTQPTEVRAVAKAASRASAALVAAADSAECGSEMAEGGEAAGDGAVGGVVGIGQRGGIDECVGGVGEDVGEVVAHEETEGEAVAQPDAQIMHAEAADGADGSDPREEAVGRGGGVRSEREQLAGEADARLGALGRAARQLDLARDGVGGGELGQYAAREQRPEHVERRLAMPVDEELHLPLEVLARHVVGRRGQRPRLRHAVDGKLDVSQLVGARGGGHAHRRHETHGDGGCRGAGCSGRAVGAARAVAPSATAEVVTAVAMSTSLQRRTPSRRSVAREVTPKLNSWSAVCLCESVTPSRPRCLFRSPTPPIGMRARTPAPCPESS